MHAILLATFISTGLLRPLPAGAPAVLPAASQRARFAVAAEPEDPVTTTADPRLAQALAEWEALPADTDEATLRRRFRSLAQRYHPDANDAADAVERFQTLAAEYERRLRRCRTVAQRAELESQWLAAMGPFLAVAGVASVGGDPVLGALATAVLGGITFASEGKVWGDSTAESATGGRRSKRRGGGGASPSDRAPPLLRAALAQLLPGADASTRKLLGMPAARSLVASADETERVRVLSLAAEAELNAAAKAVAAVSPQAQRLGAIAGAAAQERWGHRAVLFSEGTEAVIDALQRSGGTKRGNVGAVNSWGSTNGRDSGSAGSGNGVSGGGGGGGGTGGMVGKAKVLPWRSLRRRKAALSSYAAWAEASEAAAARADSLLNVAAAAGRRYEAAVREVEALQAERTAVAAEASSI